MKALFAAVLAAVVLSIAACSVKQPGSVETQIAQTVKHDLTVGGGKEKNPFDASPENVKHG